MSFEKRNLSASPFLQEELRLKSTQELAVLRDTYADEVWKMNNIPPNEISGQEPRSFAAFHLLSTIDSILSEREGRK